MNKIQQLTHFFKAGIWDTNIEHAPVFKRWVLQSLKVISLAIKGVLEDKVMLRASALTYFTLLSIVPVLAIAFALAKGFGMDKLLEKQLLEVFQGQEEILTTGLEFAKNLLDSTSGGLVAGIGVAFLLYSVMKLLNNIEASFNDIWYVHKHRTLTRKLTDYVAMVLLGLILMFLANGLTVVVTKEIARLTNSVEIIGFFKGIIFPLLSLLPVIIWWMLFTLAYMVMPNTTVKFKSALIAGIVAGTLFQMVQLFLFKFGVNVGRYNAIYGSFAALPLFLIWLQTSWMIMLFGSEVSYSVQNVHNYESSFQSEGFSLRFKKKVALAVSYIIIDKFKKGKQPLSLDEINNQIKVPSNFLKEVIEALIKGNLLSEITNTDKDSTYQPALDTDLLTVQLILSRFEESGKSSTTAKPLQAMQIAQSTLSEIDELVEKSGTNKLIKSM